MARRKSISDIARQSETIRQRLIRSYGTNAGIRAARPLWYNMARNATNRYIENIRKAQGLSEWEARNQRWAGVRAATTGLQGAGYSTKGETRSVYMGLNEG